MKINKYLKLLLKLGAGSSLVLILGVGGFVLYMNANLPEIESLTTYNPSVPSYITSRDGEVLAKLSKEDRQVVSIDKIPRIVVNSFLAAEDDKFFEHNGVDLLGVMRALVVNIKAGRVVQGGSTITQQVAKSFLLSSERSITRKIKDFLLAIKIEKKFSKKEILHLYLNQVYLGGGYYGVKSAFSGYFGKDLDEVSVAESAMVAGLLVAPGRYSPYINPEYAKRRQNYVLGRLRATQKISNEEYDAANSEKIEYRLRELSNFKAGHFTDWVRQRVTALVGNEEFLTGGYQVKTTLNYQLQVKAEEEIQKGVSDIDKRQGYAGALRRIALNQKKEELTELWETVKTYREKVYSENSHFFILNDQFEKQYELSLEPDEMNLIQEHYTLEKEEKGFRYFFKGYRPEDRFLKFLKINEIYEAVVINSFNRGEVILVDIGGVRGLIDKNDYSWAHERVISENPQWHAPVDRPTKIVKEGDVVLVKINSMKTTLLKKFSKKYANIVRSSNSYKKIAKKLNDQDFLDCSLEQRPEVQAALVSMSPRSGEILSLVGGSDFNESQFNRVIQSLRQPGSSFKPLLFAASLENGYKPNSIIIDSPEALASDDVDVNWKPKNYDGKFMGPMTLRRALELSRNVPTVKLAQSVGVSRVHKFTDRIGFEAKMDKDLSLSLGSFGVTLLDIVKSYAIFPSGGKYVEPKSILEIRDRNGNLIEFEEKKSEIILSELHKKHEQVLIAKERSKEESKEAVTVNENKIEISNSKGNTEVEEENKYLKDLDKVQVYDKRLAYIMTNLLKGVVSNGTGAKARSLSPFVGGKTGTTSSYVDAWFIGFASNLVTGVWTGFDQNQTMGYGEAGSKSALPIWKSYMEFALDKLGKFDFPVPKGIVNVYIDKDTGRVSEGATFLEAFVEGYEPGAEEEAIKIDENSQLNIVEEDDYYNSL